MKRIMWDEWKQKRGRCSKTICNARSYDKKLESGYTLGNVTYVTIAAGFDATDDVWSAAVKYIYI